MRSDPALKSLRQPVGTEEDFAELGRVGHAGDDHSLARANSRGTVRPQVLRAPARTVRPCPACGSTR